MRHRKRHRLLVMRGTGAIGQKGLVCLAVIVSCLSAPSGPVRAADGLAPFCEQRLVRDYLSPLARMPRLHGVPKSGRLPFAPKAMTLVVLGDGLRVGKGLIGFRFSDEAIGARRHLSWTSESVLVRVNRAGDISETLGSKTIRLGREMANSIGGTRFAVSGRPAFYRVDLIVRSKHGVVLGKYGAYFRVVRSSTRSRLTLNASVRSPGQTILASVENPGTAAILPGSIFRVERAEGPNWAEFATVPVSGLKPRTRAVLFAGEVSPCVSYQLPSDIPEGMYRISNQISASKGGFQKVLFRQFRVGDAKTRPPTPTPSPVSR